MLNFNTPITEKHSINNFSMVEKTPIGKINLRGNIENKDFVSKVGKILGIILPKEACSTSTKEKITSLWLCQNECLIVSNEKIGYFKDKLKVYGRFDQECFRCLGEQRVLKIRQSGRSSFFCSKPVEKWFS